MSKKNIRKIPAALRRRLERLEGLDVVAGCSRTYSAAELQTGVLSHLGVALTEEGLTFPPSIMPTAASGKYSDRNRHGYEEVRRDLPKETHYNTVETPNYGDSYYGTHTVDLPYEKYPRDFYAPTLASIKISAPNVAPGEERYTIVFEVDRVLSRRDGGFEASLLEALNLLQENVGAHGVQKSGATFADYLKTITVSWEVLPPGTREEAIERLFGRRQPTAEQRATVEDRYDFLMGLNPPKLVYGMSGIQRYFGALLADNFVIFENVEYGNAIYVMFADWKQLSQRTRTELLSGTFGENFQRIVHASGWKERVKAIVKSVTRANKQVGGR